MWGSNHYGQLGNGTGGGDIEYDEGIDSNVPIKIMDNVASVSLGAYTSAAITSDGSLYIWGDNWGGQLGNGKSGGSEYEYDEEIDSNVPIKTMDNVASVSLGYEHSAAITSDGSLYMWGNNGVGQLGNGTTEDSVVPIKIMDRVMYINPGIYHSAAITADGSLYMWGYNAFGELGNDSTEDSNVPIRIMDNVASVSLGEEFSAAITTDGSLYMWGSNCDGQLGNGENIGNFLGPIDEEDANGVPIKIMDNIASVSLGYRYSAAITTDGSLYMWGYNEYGQLGNGKSGGDFNEYDEGIDSNVPIKIEIPAE